MISPLLGRLRLWLLAGFSNHLSSRRTQALRLKRGGGMKHVPVDRQSLESFYQTDMAAVRFRQRYRRLLLDVAAERLGITCEARPDSLWKAPLLTSSDLLSIPAQG